MDTVDISYALRDMLEEDPTRPIEIVLSVVDVWENSSPPYDGQELTLLRAEDLGNSIRITVSP